VTRLAHLEEPRSSEQHPDRDKHVSTLAMPDGSLVCAVPGRLQDVLCREVLAAHQETRR
jgi:hypothetical protein